MRRVDAVFRDVSMRVSSGGLGLDESFEESSAADGLASEESESEGAMLGEICNALMFHLTHLVKTCFKLQLGMQVGVLRVCQSVRPSCSSAHCISKKVIGGILHTSVHHSAIADRLIHHECGEGKLEILAASKYVWEV